MEGGLMLRTGGRMGTCETLRDYGVLEALKIPLDLKIIFSAWLLTLIYLVSLFVTYLRDVCYSFRARAGRSSTVSDCSFCRHACGLSNLRLFFSIP